MGLKDWFKKKEDKKEDKKESKTKRVIVGGAAAGVAGYKLAGAAKTELSKSNPLFAKVGSILIIFLFASMGYVS